MRRSFIAALFLSVMTLFSLTAQEEDSDWFWDQPIAKIEFEGLKNVKKSELTGIVSSFIDEPFTDSVFSDLMDRLYALDLFEDLEPFAKHASKNDSKVLLVIKVTEHPVIGKILFKGNQKIRNGELRELIKTKASDVYVENKILMDERIIRDHYLQKGYTESRITHETEITEDGTVNITFNINEGANTVISAIHTTGNTIVSERVLKSKLKLKEVGFLKDGAFQNTTLEQDKQVILSYYQERGYVDAAIVDVKLETKMNETKQRQELTITFVIQEGSQYTFAGMTVSGNEVFSSEELLSLMKLKEGAIFNALKFEEGVSAITSKYYENGYMGNEFYPYAEKNTEKNEISYKLVIRESVRSHIENIIVKGNSKTKDYVIKREFPLEAGDVFSRDKVMSGLRNLYNLQFFSSVVPDVQQGSEQNLVDLVVSVEEQSTTSLQFGMTFSGVTDPDDIPLSLYLKVENSNLFGEGKSVSASSTISKNEQSIDLSYAQSWIGSLPISYSQSLSFSHKNSYTQINMFLPDMTLDQYYYYANYEGWTASLGTAFGRRWNPDFGILTLSAGMNNSLTNYIYDEALYTPTDLGISIFANRWGILNSLWTSFSIDDRDINYDPSKGWFASERVAWYGLMPKLEQEFFLRSDTKLEGYLTLFNIPVTESWNFKGILAGITSFSGLFPVNGTAISESNRLYIDGMFNGRGWTEVYKLSSAKGQAMWSTNVELRFPILPNLVGVDIFHDSVIVKQSVNDMFSAVKFSDFYFSFGPGIRFLIPQFPLHLMFAFKYKYYEDVGKLKFDETPFQFVLSFNVVNK